MVEFGWRAAGCQALDTAEQELLSGAAAGAGAAATELPWGQQPYHYELRMTRQRASGSVGGGGAAALAAGEDGGEDAEGGEKRREAGDPAAGELMVRAKVVIGADGYFSRIRREVSGEDALPACLRACMPACLHHQSSRPAGLPLVKRLDYTLSYRTCNSSLHRLGQRMRANICAIFRTPFLFFLAHELQLLGGTPPVFSGMVMWRGSFTAEELSSGAVPLPPAAFGAGASDRAASHRWMPAGTGIAPGQGRVLLLFLAQVGLGVWQGWDPWELSGDKSAGPSM